MNYSFDTMNGKFPSLFSEFKLGNLVLKNRMGLAPMTRTSADADGTVTADMIKYYSRYARGGFSLLITEGTYIDEMHSQGYYHQPGIANSRHITHWRTLVKSVQKEGAKIFCQLMHAGALSQGNYYTQENIGPSAIRPVGQQMAFYGGSGAYAVPGEITRRDIDNLIENFFQAAVNAKNAGFNGVELHGANGYLLDQFLTDYTNHRTDEYGGSTRNRVRLLVQVIQACRAAVGADYPLGIRISQGKVNNYSHQWADQEKDAAIIFSSLAEAGADFIHVTAFEADKPAFGQSGLPLAGLARKYAQLPVIANGSLNTPERAESLLISQHADMVTLGKSALANKDWVKKVEQGYPLHEFDPQTFLSPNACIKDFEL